MSISYSKWSMWDACPKKYKFRYIDGLVDKPTGAMSRGTIVHQSIEDFLLKRKEELHPDIHKFYHPYFSAIRDMGAIPEFKFAVTPDWQLTDFDDPAAYIRGFMDVLVPPVDAELIILEVKTGREYPGHLDQRHLYGTVGLSLYPGVETVKVIGLYVDRKDNKPTIYSQTFRGFLQKTWQERVETMLADTDFPCMPSYQCERCPYAKAKNGPCEFG